MGHAKTELLQITGFWLCSHPLGPSHLIATEIILMLKGVIQTSLDKNAHMWTEIT